MKRFSKIFAILLTLALLVGAIAITASASNKSFLDASQYSDQIKNFGSYDYDTVAPGSDFSSGNGTYSDGSKLYLSTFATYGEVSTTLGSETNKYMRLVSKDGEGNNEDPTATGYPFIYYYTGKAATFDNKIQNYDFITLDFDISSDKLIDGKLGYYDGMAFSPYLVKPTAYPLNLYTITDGTDWYVSTSKTYSATATLARLSRNVGEWNHITMVFAHKNASTTTPVYIYVNGNYLVTVNLTTTDATELQRLSMLTTATLASQKYSVCVDNVTANYYAKGYSSNGYGISTMLASDPTLSISKCNDVVFNKNYSYLAAPETQKIGDAYIPALAVDSVEENSTITTTRDMAITSAPSASKFKIVAPDGAKVTLSDSLKDSWTCLKGEGEDSDVYVIAKKSASANANIDDFYVDGAKTTGNAGNYGDMVNFNSAAVVDGNTCWRFKSKTGLTSTTTYANANRYFYVTKSGDKNTDYPGSTGNTNYNAVVIDFDVAAFDYVYLPDNATDGVYRAVTDKSALSETELATVRLSYFEKAQIALLNSGWNQIYFVTDQNGRWYLSADTSYDDSDIALSEKAGEWNHVTILYDMVTPAIHFYVNGEYLSTRTTANKHIQRLTFFRIGEVKEPLTHSADLNAGIDNITIKAYNNSYSSANDVYGLDNYMALANPKLPISFIEDITFNYQYDSSFDIANTVELIKGDKSYKFANLAAAIYAADDGDTLKVDGDLTLYVINNDYLKSLKILADSVTLIDKALAYTYGDGTLNKLEEYKAIWKDANGDVLYSENIAIDAIPDPTNLKLATKVLGNYNVAGAWKYAIGSGDYLPLESFAGVSNGDEVVIIPDTSTVNWYESEDEEPIVELWFDGSTASRAYELPIFDNGWYELGYYWNTKSEDMTVSSGEEKDFVLKIEPVSAVDIRYNYMLGAQFYPNYYISAPIDGVVINTVYTANGITVQNSANKYYVDEVGPITEIHALAEWTGKTGTIKDATETKEIVSLGGQTYYKYNAGSIITYGWYSMTGFQVNFTVTYEGVEYELNSTPAITAMGYKRSASSYANAVFKDKRCSKETKLLANWLQYMNASYSATASASTLADVNKLLNDHKTLNPDCDCIKDITDMIPTTAPEGYTYTNFANVEGLAGMGATYYVDRNAGRLGLFVPTSYVDEVGVDNLRIYAELVGIKYNSEKSIYQSGQNIKVNFSLYYVKDDTTEDPDDVIPYVNNGCYLFLANILNFKMFNLHKDVNIVLKAEGNTVCSGTYSMATYIYNRNAALGLYTIDPETGKYVQAIADADLNDSHRMLKLALALAAFGEASYEYMVDGTELAK